MARYSVPGPCKVYWNNQDLGYTKSGVVIRVNTGMVPIIDDEHGTEPADFIRAGKSAVVEVVLNSTAGYKAALAAVTGASYPVQFGIKNTSTPLNKIGSLANDGAGGTQYGKAFKIIERVPTNIWIADFSLMSDPQQLLLASTQELLLPLTFVIAMNDTDQLFSTVPSYMR